jgi:hypothetical protein
MPDATPKLVVSGAIHAELRRIRLANDDCPCGAQTGNVYRISRRFWRIFE